MAMCLFVRAVLQSFVALRCGQGRESIDQEFEHSRQAREVEED
jgi:hypothetical protein